MSVSESRIDQLTGPAAAPRMTATQTAEALRYCAAVFRGQADHGRERDMREVAGSLIVHACKHGYLPDWPELDELVEFFTSEPDPAQPRKLYETARCPYNLFLAVVGGHVVLAQRINGKIEAIGDNTGGLLRTLDPARFHDDRLLEQRPAARGERYALGCEFLAERIERTAASGTVPAPAKPKKKRGPKVRYIPEDDRRIIRDYEASNLSEKKFEQERNLPPKTVHNAKNREKSRKHRRRGLR